MKMLLTYMQFSSMMKNEEIRLMTSKFPVENSKTRARAKSKKKVAKAEPKANNPIPVKAANDTIIEENNDKQTEELASRFIMKLPDGDLQSIRCQKKTLDDASTKAANIRKEAFSSQVIANMIRVAYDEAWRVLQKKHGLPESLDIDWEDGSIYRKVEG
jgi:hypothetical protein